MSCDMAIQSVERIAGGVEIAEFDSTSIPMASYDPVRKILAIHFKSGHSYNYFAVPRDIWTAFKQAESVGKFYHANIRDIYESERIEVA